MPWSWFQVSTWRGKVVERSVGSGIKSHIWKTLSKHYLQWWKIESNSPKVRNKTRVPILTTTIPHSSGSFGHSYQSRKGNKRNPDWKRRSKTLTVCRWHDPLHQFSSVTQSCPTLCDYMNCSTPGLPVYHQLLEFNQTHVHWINDAIQPSHPLLSPFPPASNPPQHQSLVQWVNTSHEVAKVLEFQL